MIDVMEEDLIDLHSATKERPFKNSRTGKACAVGQIYRYVGIGARTASGDRVKLETVRVPQGLRTSREAIVRFIAALTDPDRPTPTPRKRKKQIDKAEAELEAAGFEVGGGAE